VYSTAIPAATRAVGRASVTQAIATSERRTAFGLYLDAAMRESKLNDVRLAERSGLDKSNFSHWRVGRTQPKAENLRAIAPHINRRLGDLLIVAGHATAEELGMIAPDIPIEIKELVEAIKDVADHERQAMLALVRQMTKTYKAVRPAPKKRSRR